MGLNVVKCIEIHINQKGQTIAKNGPKWPKNGRKLQIITKYQKLLNMVTKCCQECPKCQKMPKWAKNGGIRGQI